MATIWQRLAGWVTSREPNPGPSLKGREQRGSAPFREYQRGMAVAEDENSITVGSRWLTSDRERVDFSREEILEQALEAWRVNPLARRLVELTTQYVIGSGVRVSVSSPHPSPLPGGEGTDADEEADRFVKEWWNHRLNQVDFRLAEWCDELSRSGELFLLVSTDGGGMSYVRAVAAEQVLAVHTAENDVQQEIGYEVKTEDGLESVVYPGRDLSPGPSPERGGEQSTVMLHYAINRPVGTVRGESDLAPVLRWLSRYSGWLEDRARLNRYRNTFLFTVQAKFADEAERAARQAALALNPPAPGSILVTDESEVWSVLSPKLESHEAGADGLALKKMIAAGTGIPLHFLAEPESSTRTTAEAAGGPTYRRFEQRQRFFCCMLQDLIGFVLERRGIVGADIKVMGGDLSARDNAALAVAGSTVAQFLQDFRDRQVVDDAELLRLTYRFLGENVDLADVLEAGKKATPPPAPPRSGEGSGRRRRPRVDAGPRIKVKVDAETGDVTGEE